MDFFFGVVVLEIKLAQAQMNESPSVSSTFTLNLTMCLSELFSHAIVWSHLVLTLKDNVLINVVTLLFHFNTIYS